MSTWYRTGTISVSNGSTTVIGNGSAFVNNVSPGMMVSVGIDIVGEVLTVTSDTALELAVAYAGSAITNSPYAIANLGSVRTGLIDAIESVKALFQTYESGVLAGRFADGTIALPGLRFNSEPDLGLRRVSAGKIAITEGGADILILSANEATGTAVQQSATDATATRLMKVGAFGLGGAAISLTNADDLNDLTQSGFYYNPAAGNTTGNNYPVSSAGALWNTYRSGSNHSQIYITFDDIPEMYIRSWGQSGWSPWLRSGVFDGNGDLDVPGEKLVIGGSAMGGFELTVDDDSVAVISAPTNGAFLSLKCNADTDFPQPNHSAKLFIDAGSSPAIDKQTGWNTVGTRVATSTTLDLNGTAGVSGDTTISVLGGVCKIENRSGGPLNYTGIWS